jgi:hypothetical protein
MAREWGERGSEKSVSLVSRKESGHHRLGKHVKSVHMGGCHVGDYEEYFGM